MDIELDRRIYNIEDIGKWSKLDKTEFPFSEERRNYLIMKFVFEITDPKDNPRVAQ